MTKLKSACPYTYDSISVILHTCIIIKREKKRYHSYKAELKLSRHSHDVNISRPNILLIMWQTTIISHQNNDVTLIKKLQYTN
jgi:hypothetical protein